MLAAAEEWSAAVWREATAAGPLTSGPEQVDRGIGLAAQPVFLCGAHRSGTTLLRDLLDDHPHLCVLPSEGTFLTSLSKRLHRMSAEEWCGFLTREWLRRLANPIGREPFWCLGRSTEHAAPYVEYARRAQGWWPLSRDILGDRNRLWPHVAIVLAYDASRPRTAESRPARHWVDKTPTHELYLETLLQAFPSARVIQMIRDPRAVVASRRELEDRARGRLARPDRLLRELRASMRIALEAEGRPNHLVVRYEDLVSSPERELKRVARFLDLAPHEALYRTTVAGRLAGSNSSFDVTVEAGAIHSDGAADRRVSEDDDRLVAAYLGNIPTQLGYEASRIGPARASLTRLRFDAVGRWHALRGRVTGIRGRMGRR